MTQKKLRLSFLSQSFRIQYQVVFIHGSEIRFKSFVYIPHMETTLTATPKRHRNLKKIIEKIYYSETFIETQKKIDIASCCLVGL